MKSLFYWEGPTRMNLLRRVLKGIKYNMYEFNRKLLSGFAISVVVIAIMIVSLINSSSTSVSYSEREQQLLRKQNNPFGYQDNEVIEKIIVDKGTNVYNIDQILEDKDEMKSYYIVVWRDNSGLKMYQKVSSTYFEKVNPGDTWDGKTTTSEEENEGDYSSTHYGYDEW